MTAVWLSHLLGYTLLGLAGRTCFLAFSGIWAAPADLRALYWGLRFDSAVAGVLALSHLGMVTALRAAGAGSRVSRVFSGLLAFAMLALQGADFVYFQESGRHLTYEIRDTVNSSGSIVAEFLAHWPLLLLALGTATAFALAAPVPRPAPHGGSRSRRLRRGLALGIVSAAVTLLCVRGGIAGITQSPSSAFKIGDARLATIALNGAYSSLYGLAVGDELKREPVTAPAGRPLREIVGELYEGSPGSPPGPARIANVLFVLLEGWPATFSKSYGAPVDGTPEFDRIRQQSLTVEALLAGGHRTTEAVFSIFCSFQNPLGQTVAKTRLQHSHYAALPQLLRDRGWQTLFFQGSNSFSGGTGPFAQALGFAQSYGKRDIPEFDMLPKNSWGVFDRDLYRFALKKIEAAGEPFLAAINTNTTHSLELPPWAPPDPGGGSGPERHQRVVSSADQDLGEFLRILAARTWNHPLIVVLVGDHPSHENRSPLASYLVPFAIYAPGLIAPEQLAGAATQRDIAPTITDLLGIPAPAWAGQSLRRPWKRRFAEYYHEGTLGWIEGPTLVEIPLVSTAAQPRCYDWRTDTFEQTSTACPDDLARQVARATAFTAYSQDLLFASRSREFLLDPPR